MELPSSRFPHLESCKDMIAIGRLACQPNYWMSIVNEEHRIFERIGCKTSQIFSRKLGDIAYIALHYGLRLVRTDVFSKNGSLALTYMRPYNGDEYTFSISAYQRLWTFAVVTTRGYGKVCETQMKQRYKLLHNGLSITFNNCNLHRKEEPPILFHCYIMMQCIRRRGVNEFGKPWPRC